MKEIISSNGYRVQVDDEDYEYLNQFGWFADKTRVFRSTTRNSVQINLTIQKEIYNIHKIDVTNLIDHKDRNFLNNQKENLRLATKSQNMINRNNFNKHTSGFRGVHYEEIRAKYICRISNNGKQVHIGQFDAEIEAAKAYNRAAKMYHGEFAQLNEIPGE